MGNSIDLLRLERVMDNLRDIPSQTGIELDPLTNAGDADKLVHDVQTRLLRQIFPQCTMTANDVFIAVVQPLHQPT